MKFRFAKKKRESESGSFDPERIAKKVKNKTSEAVSNMRENQDDGPPRVFVSHGTTIFRVYYDPKSDDFQRSLWTHYHNKRPMLCLGDGCPFCEISKQVKDSLGSKAAFKLGFGAQMNRLFFGEVYRASWENKYLTLKEPAILVFRGYVGDAILKFINEKSTKVLAKQFDPTALAPPFKLRWDKGSAGKGGNVNIELSDDKDYRMSPLPKDFPALTEAWLSEDNTMPEEDIYKITKEMKRAMKNAETISDPQEDEDSDDSDYADGKTDDDDEDMGDRASSKRRRRRQIFAGGR